MLWDSMRWMPLTVVESDRSLMVTTRRSISSGLRPLYCQTTATTGMSMLGKMSTSMRWTERAPIISTSRHITAVV
jgi:hypothetical protein